MKSGWFGGSAVALVLLIAGAALAQAARPVLAAQTQPRTMMVQRLPTTLLQQNTAERAALTRLKASPAALAVRQQLSQKGLATQVDLAAIDRVSAPVLTPARPSLVANLRVFPSDNRFVLSSTEPGAVYEVVGSRTPFVASNARLLINRGLLLKPQTMNPSTQPPRLQKLGLLRLIFGGPAMAQPAAMPSPASAPGQISDVVVERTEYGVDVSFSRFGAVYNLTIACDQPDKDPRCTDAAAVEAAKGLQVLGGGQ